MFDLKTLNSALEQLEEERGISKEKILAAIEDALTAAYRKDYGKKGQIIRAAFDLTTGDVDFYQVKIVVDNTVVRPKTSIDDVSDADIDDERVFFNEEQHIMIDDARKMKKDVQVNEELTFPLETKDDYGRIAAQTAKQVIIQRIREAEKESIMGEYSDREGEIVNGKVQKIERGNVFIDLGRTTGILPREEQIPTEHYRQGERIKAYLYMVEETPRGINLRLSRSHPQFIKRLFEIEAPEVATGVVELRSIAREAGSRTKIAVWSADKNIDPVGSCVGQRGSRVNTVISELGGEKIDIIKWVDDASDFIAQALSPAKIISVELNDEEKKATVTVDPDQFSLAVGKGGQNVRLAAKLTGWKIDIITPEGTHNPVKPSELEIAPESETAPTETNEAI